jgi:hypothetical protein
MSEHRIDPRRRVLKAARILFNRRFSTVDCVVQNVSQGGACLRVESAVSIPDEFDLSMPNNDEIRACRVAWRKLDRVGVKFSDASAPVIPGK